MNILAVGLEDYLKRSLITNKITDFDKLDILEHDQFTGLNFVDNFEKYKNYNVLIVGIDKPLGALEYNFRMHYDILDNIIYIINNSNINKVIFLSSYGVYKIKESLPICEENELYAHDYLDSLFILYENMMRNACDLSNKKLVILRLFNVFSVFQNNKYIIQNIIWQLFSDNENLILGDSRRKRDFVYIEDFVNLLNIVIKKDFDKNFNVYNIGSGKSTSLREVVDIAKKVTGIDKKLIFNPEKIRSRYDFLDVRSDMTKVKSELGYESVYSLEDGLKKVIELYKFKEIMKNG